MNKIKDQLNLLSKLSIRKIFNAFQVLMTYFFAKYTGIPYHQGMPLSIAFEPTTSCNLRCPECPSGLRSFSRPTGNLNEDFYQKTLDELSPSLIYLTFYFQGEPYLHPRFTEMVQYASQKRIYTSTSTNAHYLNDKNAEATVRSGLDRLIISIDGTTQETYQAYRIGGRLDKVIEGTKNILKWRKKLKSSTPFVIFQFLVVRPNEHQVEEVYQLAKELGVDQVNLKTAQIYDYQQGSDLMPKTEKYSRYKKQQDGNYAIKNQLLNQCWRMWNAAVITWNGMVVPCCFDKDALHPLGDLQTQNFKTVWNNPLYKEFRRKILVSRKEIDICQNCTEGTKVWAEQ